MEGGRGDGSRAKEEGEEEEEEGENEFFAIKPESRSQIFMSFMSSNYTFYVFVFYNFTFYKTIHSIEYLFMVI